MGRGQPGTDVTPQQHCKRGPTGTPDGVPRTSTCVATQYTGIRRERDPNEKTSSLENRLRELTKWPEMANRARIAISTDGYAPSARSRGPVRSPRCTGVGRCQDAWTRVARGASAASVAERDRYNVEWK